MIVILGVRKNNEGPLQRALTAEHLHDLGKLMFAFSNFWMYIWFSQYMLIWYTNIPEETSYFVTRVGGTWGPILLLSLLLNWVVSFLILLPVKSKRDPRIVIKVCGAILAGRCVDLYLMMLPTFAADEPFSPVWAIAAAAAVAGVFMLRFDSEFGKEAAVTTDPRVAEALSYHN